MSQVKRKLLLNRKETRTLLNTVKVVTAAGAFSLTVAGWGLLAELDVRNGGNAQANRSGAMVVPSADAATAALDDAPTSARPPTPQPVKKLDIVQWVHDTSGNPVAVVRDVRGALWFVMGSDVPRLEQGQPPVFQPQLVQRTTRTRAS
jgi:hypothetical protein